LQNESKGKLRELVSLPRLFLRRMLSHECRASSRTWRLRGSFPNTIRQAARKRPFVPHAERRLALFNLVVGYILFQVGKVAGGERLALGLFFAGIAALSIMASISFQTKHAR
jgi:hypothetical protein